MMGSHPGGGGVRQRQGIQMISSLEVDAQENPLANTVAYGVYWVHRHITMTGHLYGARGLFAHRPTWDEFDTDFRRGGVQSDTHRHRGAATSCRGHGIGASAEIGE